jgi:molecular chaperone GrpE
MEHNEPTEPRRIRVTDRRGAARSQGEEAGEFTGEDIGAPDAPDLEGDTAVEEVIETVPLDDFLRMQADFDNRRKRMMRETAMATERARRDVFEQLLPVLDNFDRAIAHAEDVSGLEIVHKDLLRVLEGEGLEEIPAEGQPFDYHVHDAMSSHEDSNVTEEIVAEVLLKGYRLKDQVLRHAKVVVARPQPDEGANEPQADG